MKSTALALPLLLLLPLEPSDTGPIVHRAAPVQDACDVRRELDGRLDAARLQGVLVRAEAGSLEVAGAPGDQVRVRAVVCASDASLADDARLVVEQRRDAAWVEADLPDRDRGWRDAYVRMDLVIEMPARLPADISDGSGGIVVRGIAGVAIDDGSGGIRVDDVAGPVHVEDGSGDVTIRGAASVELDDGSGGIGIADVRGAVRISEDGSGSIEVRDVVGDVRIDEDGSGSIRVERVGGDFVLEDDGSGSVRHRDVRGRVVLPDG